ncbi:MAG TPA: cohesin domain-containing protein [Dehalococcoidia bacterium]|nr:cohesin domain-containing protein [Dehalococcoidia bacterium]
MFPFSATSRTALRQLIIRVAVVSAVVAAFLITATLAYAASASNFKIGSATIAPGESVTIPITIDADQVGAFGFTVQYDASLVTPTDCTAPYGVCNVAFGPDTVRINGATISGINGDDALLGTITFQAGLIEGTSALALVEATFHLSDTEGNELETDFTNGQIIIEAEEVATGQGCPHSASANAAAHANPHSAHGNAKQSARDCD